MKKIAVLLTEGFADWEYALIGGTGGPFYGFEVEYFAPHVGFLRSQGGLQVRAEHGLDELASWGPQVVVVVGGMIWETAEAPVLGDLLVDLHSNEVILAGTCGGTLALARAGLLDHVAHTSNDQEFLEKNADNYKGQPNYKQSAAAVADQGIITAPGTAPVSFAAAIFESVGMEKETSSEFRQMMAAEHG